MECSRYGQFKGSGGTLSTNVGFKQDRSHQLNAAHELREAIVEYRQATEWSTSYRVEGGCCRFYNDEVQAVSLYQPAVQSNQFAICSSAYSVVVRSWRSFNPCCHPYKYGVMRVVTSEKFVNLCLFAAVSTTRELWQICYK